MKEKSYIECAKIINTHGCHGGIKMESWCNTPEVLAGLKKIFLYDGTTYKEYRIQKASVFKQFVLAELAGVSDMDAALALKNKICYALRKDFDLDEGEYFIADLKGLPVVDADNGREYGKVKELINRGASDLYVVQTANGEVMIPAVPEFIEKVDIEKGVFVRPIDGMFSVEEV